MIRVLHVIQGCGGGVASLVGNLIRSADSQYLRQDVLSFGYENGEAFLEGLRRAGSRSFLLPRPRKEGYAAFRSYMLQVLRDGGYDVVHCHSHGWRTCLYRSVAKEAGVKLFCVHSHRAANDPGRLANSKAYIRMEQYFSRKNADLRFACGREAARFIYGSEQGAIVIPNGIDLDRCHQAAAADPALLRQQLGLSPQTLAILQVGRLVVQKNHDFTLKIARELEHRGMDATVLVAGAGPLEQQLRQQLQEQGLEHRVRLLGRRDDVYELMAMADAMILPSLYEGLPTVAIEAQAMGLYSILADRVTDECDLGLGLVRQLRIDGDAHAWVDAIERCRSVPVPDRARIDRALEAQAYTAQTSLQRYIGALEQGLG